MADYRHYHLSREGRIIFTVSIVIVGIAVSFLMYRSIVFAVVITPFVPRISGYVTDYLNERRKLEYMQEFKDFLFLAATSIGAGRAMPDAISEAVPGLIEIYGEKSIMVRELRAVLERVRENHEDDVTVLMDMAVLSGLEDVVDFVTIYQVCKQTGADLITSMNKASQVIIDKMTIEREIHEISKRKEAEGMFIFAMPVMVIVLLNISSPEYIAPLYETLIGRLIMTGVVAGDIAIYGMIQKITHVEL